MKRITQIILIILSVGLLISLAAYVTYLKTNNGLDDSNTPIVDMDWETTVEALTSGKVVEVVQSHNLEVTLTLDDGSRIRTVEPSLDEIFREIDLCGDVCREIILVTE